MQGFLADDQRVGEHEEDEGEDADPVGGEVEGSRYGGKRRAGDQREDDGGGERRSDEGTKDHVQGSPGTRKVVGIQWWIPRRDTPPLSGLQKLLRRDTCLFEDGSQCTFGHIAGMMLQSQCTTGNGS